MRRTKEITIPGTASDAPGHRDDGKTFIITEMSADEAESWAMESLLALTNAGAEVPDASHGMAGLASAGLEALQGLKYDVVKPLMDRMLTCVKFQGPNKNVPAQPLLKGDLCQVEEVTTLLMLRREIFKLHTDFFIDAGA